MGRKSGRVLLTIACVLVAFFVALKLRYAGKAPVKLSADHCDTGLWKHAYKPERLQVIEPCTAVEGRVASVHNATDGDLHIGLEPDHASVLNLVNVFHMRRRLVVEIVCHHPPQDKESAASCAGFNSTITAPGRGDRVRVTGAYVTDRDNGWNEIHPVTRIQILYQ